MRSSQDVTSTLPITNPRHPRHKASKEYGYLKDIVNTVLLLIALFLALDLLFGRHEKHSRILAETKKEDHAADEPTLNCFRPVRLHNAFSSLCHPEQPGVVYSARFGGLGGWELEILHSGDFANSFHVFDPTPLISERQIGIEYHSIGLGLQEENITLSPPSRPEHTYSFISNQTEEESHGKALLSVSVESLEMLMRQFGHSHLAMLHLDLGGMETFVVDGWLRTGSKPPVDQIIIRFSSKPFAFPGQTDPVLDATHNMRKLGFRVIDAWETEFNFVHQDAVQEGFWASKGKQISS